MTLRSSLSSFRLSITWTVASILTASAIGSTAGSGALSGNDSLKTGLSEGYPWSKPACLEQNYELLRGFVRFSEFLQAGNSLSASAHELQDYLRKAKGTACEASLQRTYAVMSLGLLHPRYGTFSLNPRFSQLIHVALNLAQSDRLVALSTSKDVPENQRYHGQYDCRDSTIALNFDLDPVNLGSVFYHELSHFIRDKLTASTARDPSLEEWIADETLASLHAAWAQFRFVFDWNRMGAKRPHRRVVPHRKAQRRLFQIFPELLFSQEQGPLFQLFKRRVRQDGLGLFASLSEILPHDPTELERQMPELIQVISGVAGSYFPESPYDPKKVIQIIGAELAKGEGFLLDRRLDLRGSDSFGKYGRIASVRDARGFPLDWEIVLVPRERRVSDGDWADWLKLIDTPSANCLAEKSGKEGTRPGKEGTRPGKEGTRPCVNSGLRL